MSAVPDAWDDDWQNVVDKAPTKPKAAPVMLSRAERKAQHAEANRQLWEAAESHEQPYFLEAKNNIPLKEEIKPQLKVLSRKPQPMRLASRSGATPIEDDEDSEEEARRKNAESLAERQRKAAIEREEKQRKYAEVRERLFGPTATGQSSESGSKSPAGRDSRQGSRRGRGGRGGSHANSSAEQSPARHAQTSKQLFDPSVSSKPRTPELARSVTPKDEQPIRQPRGPDSSGRGGFGIALRGGRPVA
ncbi:hypothetical protein MBLNU457_5644t1 [Dothideomycetes sp. NU457]